jgi:phage I-like protein
MTPSLLAASAVQVGGHRALRALMPLVGQDAPTVWIHVAYEGAWEGHPSGPFELTRDGFLECVANFEAQANPVPLDYEHASEFAFEAPAAGWVQSLEVRDGDDGRAHLWAHVELTDKAAEYIRTGAYRFTSGVFDFEATDRVTGEPIGCEFRSLALTGRPFIDGQTPVSLSRRNAGERTLNMKIKIEDLIAKLQDMDVDEASPEQLGKVAEALGLMAEAESGDNDEPEEAPEAPMMDEPKEEPPALADAEKVAAMDEEPVELMDPPEEEVSMADPAGDMIGARLAAALGVDEAAAIAMLEERLDEVVAAMQGSLDEAPAADAPLSDTAHELRVATLALSARDDALRVQGEALKAAQAELATYHQKEAEAEVEALIVDGRILDDKRADMVALRMNSPEAFRTLASALPQVVPVEPHASAVTATAPKSLSDDDPRAKRIRERHRRAGIPANVTDQTIRQLAAGGLKEN